MRFTVLSTIWKEMKNKNSSSLPLFKIKGAHEYLKAKDSKQLKAQPICENWLKPAQTFTTHYSVKNPVMLIIAYCRPFWFPLIQFYFQ